MIYLNNLGPKTISGNKMRDFKYFESIQINNIIKYK